MGSLGQSDIEETEKELANFKNLVNSLSVIRKKAVDIVTKTDKNTGIQSYYQNVDQCKAQKPALLSNLIDMVVAAKKVLEKTQTLENHVIKLTAENRRLEEYRNIYGKMEEGFVGWKKEIVEADHGNMTVGEAVDKILPEILPKIVEPTVKEANKKWSDLFKTGKEEMKRQTTEAKNQSKLLEKAIDESKQKQAVENIERQKRERNVCIRNIAESQKTSDNERLADDRAAIAKILDIDPDKINSVHRVGKPDQGKGPRVLVAVLETPGLAKYLHNYGRGKPVELNGKTYWINQDLIKADRDANWNARQLRNKQRSTSGNSKVGLSNQA